MQHSTKEGYLTPKVIIIIALLALVVQTYQRVEKADESSSNDDDDGAQESHTEYERTKTKSHCNETQQQQFDWSPSGVWCERDTPLWRSKYADELRSQGRMSLEEASTNDERLANILHTLNARSLFDTRLSYFNSGDRKRDARNKLAVAGPEVDDSRCARDLAGMSKIFDELQGKLERARASASVSASLNSTLEVHHIQLARVLDSFGRYESGSLEGRARLVGNYDECEDSRLLLVDDEMEKPHDTLEMRFCWANLNIERALSPLAHEPGVAHLMSTGVCLPRSCHSKNFYHHKHKKVVQKLVDSQLGLPASIYVHQTYALESVFCLVDSDSEYGKLPLSGKLCLLATGCWILVCSISTFLNKQKEQESGQKGRKLNLATRLLQHLDCSKSWRDFTSDKRQVNGNHEKFTVVDLDALNPIKLFTCIFCIVTHTALMLGSAAAGQMRIASVVGINRTLQNALLTSTIIDTFFVISGLRITYVTLKKLNESSRRRRAALDKKNDDGLNIPTNTTSLPSLCSNDDDDKNRISDTGKLAKRTKQHRNATITRLMGQWSVLALNRYLRIVPLYALLFWFRRDVLTYLGHGPLWDHGLNRETSNGACAHEAWWVPFTFASALNPLAKQCFVSSWPISSDLFFGLMIVPILILYTMRPRLALLSTITLVLVFIAITIEADPGAPVGSTWELIELRLNGIVPSFLYTTLLFRTPAFLIGSLAGCYLFKCDSEVTRAQKRQKLAKSESHSTDTTSNSTAAILSASTSASTSASYYWPRWFTGPATWMCWLYLAAHLLISCCSNELGALCGPHVRRVFFYVLTVNRSPLWASANAIIFLRMITDWRASSAITRAFAGQRWRTLAKLSFPLILSHWLVLVTFLGSLTTPASFTMCQIFAASSVVILFSLPIAAFVHVIFENPIDKLIRREIFRF